MRVLIQGAWVVPGGLLGAFGVVAVLVGGLWRKRAKALREAHKAIRERERFLARILDALPVALFGKDPGEDFRYWLWNAKAEEVFGLAREEVLGRTDFDIFPQEQADLRRAGDLAFLARGGDLEGTEAMRSPDPAATRYFHTVKTVIPMGDGAGEVLLCLVHDITEARILEASLRQSQKLESLGVLAGGIAHDFNNLLSAIGGNLELARLKMAPQPAASPFLVRIEKILRRASELTRQMLAYSGKGHFIVKSLDLNHVAEEMPRLLEVSISKRVVLDYQLETGLPPIEADEAQIQQVIMNLVTNASEAIGDRDGRITLRTGQAFLAAPVEQVGSSGWTLAPGSYVTLEVEDTGCGMSPQTQGRIFDPFFTTKFSGRGLGLSAMLGILKGHGGGIRIRSAPEEGSTFTLFFPASRRVEPPHAPVVASLPSRVAAGRILIVDDEPDLLEACAELLDSLGYSTVQARDGLEALECFREDPSAVDLVIMDLTMPRMDGKETVQAMRALDPAARIILCSGFTESEATQGVGVTSLCGFLQKPYSFEAMKTAVQGALEGDPSR